MIKLLLSLIVIALVVVIAVGALTAFSLFNSLSGEPTPPSPETIARGESVERKIEDAVTDNSAFYLELNDQELSDLLLAKSSSVSAIRDIGVSINPGTVDINGSIGGTPALPFSGTVAVNFNSGQIDVELTDVSVSFLPVPGAVEEEIQPLIDQGLDINKALNESGATQIQSFDMQPGKMTIIGIQKSGKMVSDSTKNALLEAFQSGSSSGSTQPPGASIVPPGTAGTSEPGSDLYLALGDSLAANVGVSNPQDGYVSRFHSYLERETGRDLGLLNLGISGESSISIMNGQFEQAVSEIQQRRNDGDPDTTVSVLTIDLGANDLLTHLGSGECNSDPRGEICQARLNAGIEGFSRNFPEIVGTLSSELEPGSEFYIMTMYNPFDFGLGIPFEAFSNEIVQSINAIIAENAANVGAKLADPYDDMEGKAAAWTNMLQGDIHPNPDGYQTMAFSLTEAR